MICENAQQNMILAQYGELPDELHFPLEQHIAGCEDCRREWKALQILDEELALAPVMEPSPNLLAASRMQLDEMLDSIPPRSFSARLAANFFRWMGTMQSAPALTTLLVGLGFLGGNFLTRYQVANAPKLPSPVIMSSNNGAIASVSGIVQTPNSDIVQVNYNRMVPETVQGSLDDPQIRQLLLLGTKLATTNNVHADSVAMLASYCLAGHGCDGESADGSTRGDIRSELLRTLAYDKSPTVRMKALEGLQPYVSQDRNVRDAVLVSLMQDPNEGVRSRAIAVLEPVQADSSVRQVLRTVSAQDENPAIRTASFQALQGVADIQ
jgi:hypothetical protein